MTDKMKYQAVLFDLDGTLLNTLEDLAEAVNQGLAAMGLPGHDLEAFRYLVGEGREEMVRRALPEGQRSPATVEQLVDFVNRYYGLHWCDHTRPYPGVPEMLDRLTAAGIRLAVYSNKPQEFTTQNVAGLLSEWTFERVLGASPWLPRKPDCTGALNIAADMHLPPAAFVYLGDSGIDMLTAGRAGMLAVGALWGYRDSRELLENGAQALICSPPELLSLL